MWEVMEFRQHFLNSPAYPYIHVPEQFLARETAQLNSIIQHNVRTTFGVSDGVLGTQFSEPLKHSLRMVVAFQRQRIGCHACHHRSCVRCAVGPGISRFVVVRKEHISSRRKDVDVWPEVGTFLSVPGLVNGSNSNHSAHPTRTLVLNIVILVSCRIDHCNTSEPETLQIPAEGLASIQVRL